MYKREVEDITNYVSDKGPQGIIDVGAFVLSTIQTPLSKVGPMTRSIMDEGEDSPALWGFKKKGYHDLVNHAPLLYDYFVANDVPIHLVLADVTKMSGFGLVKAGFMLQCLGYDVGCIDRHNLKRFDIHVNQVKLGKVQPVTRLRKCVEYITLTQQVGGGAERMWDEWCEYIAGNRMNKKLATADVVSRYHFDAIKGEAI